ncbi:MULTISPECIES: cupredoxin domain-containing protein [Rhizobium]|uniref:Cupredoxin domain-containing protein n=1 Tax=Rhizobium grahamii TaxID=1120045 RepID=A0A5Q0CBJ7_9HYPH|nr:MULTISPECIES: cupredoxin domain-containing protein [Rhizobium]MBO9126945.1 cupredoxin domain-containing protein [Rhizobium sp. 16-488-2b]MBO9177393.1 cupredoxin domain-containing protein [Rhizobium sp. 16-488-2a]QFY62715.1 cupredoxin domain-containing protein [Rhizobium grahamii]QRM52540.1 cupredoxin domain-containing protein [Rhizobium sp. BG6]
MSAAKPLTVLPLLFACLASPTVAEEEDPVFAVHFSNGVISPSILEVPADKRFKIELYNDGSTPIEFESIPLRKEKVLAPGASSFLVFRSLQAGDYAFFDDFHLDMPPARLIAK